MHHEAHRERYPQNGELERLVAALQRRGDRAGQFLLLLLLSGARRGELLAMRWSDVDLEAGIWTKPAAVTKQRRSHRLPLNQEASRSCARSKRSSRSARSAGSGCRRSGRPGPRSCARPGSTDLRIHDLRHWHASLLAQPGHSLVLIGAMLGHASPATTARYTALVDEAMRQAADQVGAAVLPYRSREG